MLKPVVVCISKLCDRENGMKAEKTNYIRSLQKIDDVLHSQGQNNKEVSVLCGIRIFIPISTIISFPFLFKGI